MINATPFAALAVPLIDPHGFDVVVATIKGTFDVLPNGRVTRSDPQTSLRLADVPFDPDKPTSSLHLARDVGVAKPGADVIVVGDALSATPTTSIDVAVKVRETTASLRAHGPRVFYKGLGGLTMTPPSPVERIPIVYEKAYGGATEDLAMVELRNPAGVGVAKSTSDLVDKPAPQIEDPAHPYRPGDRPSPAGFGPIPPHWSPRLERAGTFDDAWRSDRMPLHPVDYDPRAEHAANPALVLDAPLAAGDRVAVIGMSTSLVSFALPDLPVVLRARRDDGETIRTAPVLDTLVVFPNEARIELVGRVVFRMGRGRKLLREVRADAVA